MKYKITTADLREWSKMDEEMTGYTAGQIIEDGLVADATGTVFFEDGVQPTPPWTLGACPLSHPELFEVAKSFGTDHLVTKAARLYWRYHPTHSFGVIPDAEDYWCVDSEGSVWTPLAAQNPRIESELFFTHNSFYEICWNAGEVEAVFRDGQLIFCGVSEIDGLWNIILSTLDYDSPDELAVDIEGCYRLDVNPLPTLRQKLRHLPLTIQFGIAGGGHYWAAARQATLVVRLDDQTGQVGLELIDYYVDESHQWWEIRRYEDVPLSPGQDHRDALYCAARDNFELRRFEERPAQSPAPAPGPRRRAPKA